MKKKLFIAILSCVGFGTFAQKKEIFNTHVDFPDYDFKLNQKDDESERGFTFGIDLGVYLASKKTADLYNGLGNQTLNALGVWVTIEERLTQFGVNPISNITSDIERELPQYSGQVTGFQVLEYGFNMNYSPAFYFGLGANYHLNKYWAITAKSSLANIKTTNVYTMELIGPPIPQNATEVIEIFDITGEEQRVHLDLGFKSYSYNDYGFKWFWGGGASFVGARVERNTAWIGNQRYELILSANSTNPQNIIAFDAFQTNYNFGFYATTGWEMEYQDRYDFGIGFVLSRDPIELAGTTTSVFNKRIYFSFGI